jgi:hypothetical protein
MLFFGEFVIMGLYNYGVLRFMKNGIEEKPKPW